MSRERKPRPDKAKVIDEVWTDERIRSFLFTEQPKQHGQTVPGELDYYVLLRAYQAMRVHDFDRFLQYFEEQGGNFDARGPKGTNIIAYLETHRKAAEFVQLLEQRIANSPS